MARTNGCSGTRPSNKKKDKESKKMLIDENRDVDPRLWHAVAGRMVQIPEVNSNIFYFPQGHAGHAYQPVHFPATFKIPSQIPCRVATIHYRADPHTYEVYAKLRLVPLHVREVSFDDDVVGGIDNMSETKNKCQSYTKMLTRSDANNGGGFSCPRKYAETLFPPLDYSDEHNDLHVGIRRSKKRNDSIFNFSSKRKPGPSYGRLTSSFGELRISDKEMGIGKVKAGDVIEAVKLCVNMKPFDVVYYPRVGTPEFFVKPSLIRKALQVRWCCGMRFKMAMETEDSSRVHWFMGTIASVQAADPAWPDSLWRRLQVTWDQPDLLTNTKMLNPWEVEVVSDMPMFPFLPFLPSSKKLRWDQQPSFAMDGQLAMPTFPNKETLNVDSTASMQGARHDDFSFSKSSFHLEKIPLEPFMSHFRQSFNYDASTSTSVSNSPTLQKESNDENVSGSISISNNHQRNWIMRSRKS
ncbi:hypothetical protein KIW84_051764 [Lathyrus oleraceus]|uniref:Auxin response factor domain-containing protein n=1 Tax=Pisum sativum TaxID=3888 RepID=A0A9D4WKW4_PEA|nr:hypothetical protein KIW84_051764 [Pisum sativum]